MDYRDVVESKKKLDTLRRELRHAIKMTGSKQIEVNHKSGHELKLAKAALKKYRDDAVQLEAEIGELTQHLINGGW